MSEAQRKPADTLAPGEVIASRYVVEHLWRNHVLGELYRCRDLRDDSSVLLQRLRREFAGPGILDRLVDARERAAQGSTLIPDAGDSGADFDGRPFVVSRLPTGARTLAELERPIAFEEALALVEQLARALIPAHAERLVHGGLEPASALIDRDADGRPRVVALLGFGLVPALVGAAGSKTLPLLAAPTHIAPEVVRGAPQSPASDVYALGIVLWELIHGAPPFRGPTLRILDAHVSRALPELELPFDVPPAFEWILRRMLNKNPVDRFADAAALVEQLRPFSTEDIAEDIPDLTAALEPSRSQPVAVPAKEPTRASAEPAGSAVKTLPQDQDDDDERTLLFERVREPSASHRMVGAPIAKEPELVDEPPPASPRRAVRAKWLALASLAAAFMLMGLQALISARIETAAERRAAAEASQALASVDARPSERAVEQEPEPEPAAVAPTRAVEPVAASGPAILSKLGNDEFRGQKSALYRRVEQRCLAAGIRRTVEVGVRVGADGKVSVAKALGGMGGTGLGRCVEQQAGALEFPASERGGYYVYTLRLR